MSEKKTERKLALKIEELEPRIAPSAGMPAAEAFCAGGAYNGVPFQGIRFFVDPCQTIDHPMGLNG